MKINQKLSRPEVRSLGRWAQAIIYGLFGSVFVPFCGAILLIPSLILSFAPLFLSVIPSLIFVQPISIISVPFVDYSGSGAGFLLWIIPLSGAFPFALGGAFMRANHGLQSGDIRLLPRFYREVFVWMLRGAIFGTVWGVIVGIAFQDVALCAVLGALLAEFLGLWLGAARGALVRRK